MARTFLALGSNLGDRMGYLRKAALALPGPVRCSRVYETIPIKAPEGSGQFLNAVVELDLEADVSGLLALVNQLETAANRERLGPNAPRTLDVDVIFVNGMVSNDPEMTIPHPRCRERAFVVAPLSDLDSSLAETLNPEMARVIAISKERGDAEVFPGVVIYAEALC